MKVEYEVDSNERKALIDLRIKYLKQVEMGEFAAQQFALLLTREQQMQGVLVFFHPTSTHAFLQSFGTYLVRVHLYDVQYDIAGRVMTVRLLLAANVVVRQPLGTTPTTAANAGTAPNSQPSTGGAQLAPAMVVSSAPPVVNNADLYRYGIHVMPDRRIVILPAPPLSATAVPKESSPGGTASSKTNDEEEEEEEEKDGDQAMQSSSSSASSSSSSSSSWSSSSASSTPPPAQWPEGTGERIQTGSSNVPPTYLSDIRQLESARST